MEEIIDIKVKSMFYEKCMIEDLDMYVNLAINSRELILESRLHIEQILEYNKLHSFLPKRLRLKSVECLNKLNEILVK